MVEHRVGGEEVVSAVSAGVERRDAPRVKPVGAKAQIAADHGEQAEVFSLDDLSVTGFSFHLPAVRDGKRITGVAAPMEVGDVFRVGFRAGVTKDAFFYDAEVRRVVASEHGAQYLIGAAFINLSDLQRADLGETVERYLEWSFASPSPCSSLACPCSGSASGLRGEAPSASVADGSRSRSPSERCSSWPSAWCSRTCAWSCPTTTARWSL
jgi:hypothetical protein